MRKAIADEHGQHVMALAKTLAGTHGLLVDRGPFAEPDPGMWNYGYLYSCALTIGGGTSEVQRNILGEKVLGLPARRRLTSSYSSSLSAATNASCGTSTRPICFIRFLPSFWRSSSLRLRVMSPP